MEVGQLARHYSLVLGVALTVVGIAGFIPPLTPDGNVFGLFAVNGLHNVVHLLSGLVGIAVWFIARGAYARWYVLVFGFIYLIVTLLGFTQGMYVLGVLRVNVADNLLHAFIAVASAFIYPLTFNERRAMTTSSSEAA